LSLGFITSGFLLSPGGLVFGGAGQGEVVIFPEVVAWVGLPPG